MDDIIDLEIEKIDRILKKLDDDYTESEEEKRISRSLWNKIRVMALEGRRTGLGHTADADMLAALGYRFGTVEATDFIISIQKLLSVESYEESITLARERGCFPIWDREKEINNPFIKRVIFEIGEEEPYLASDYVTYGRRNIANLTIAPTGCLDKDVKIKTDRGLMSMEQIFNINGVNLNDLKNKKNVWFDCIEDISINNLDGSQNKIKKLYWNGITDGYRFIFEDNYSLFSSKVHRFLIKKSEKEAMWVSSGELKVGDKILLLQ
jgi:ribonucleoside-diphosphate reductase alpha chain